MNKGLRQRIEKAGTPEEISALLDEGATYTQADERTWRAWRATANRRKIELKRRCFRCDGTRQICNICGESAAACCCDEKDLSPCPDCNGTGL